MRSAISGSATSKTSGSQPVLLMSPIMRASASPVGRTAVSRRRATGVRGDRPVPGVRDRPRQRRSVRAGGAVVNARHVGARPGPLHGQRGTRHPGDDLDVAMEARLRFEGWRVVPVRTHEPLTFSPLAYHNWVTSPGLHLVRRSVLEQVASSTFHGSGARLRPGRSD